MVKRSSRLIWLILIVAFVLRLMVGLAQDPLAPYASNNDTGWYLGNAYAFVSGHSPDQPISLATRWSPANLTRPYLLITGRTPTLITDLTNLASPPFYFVMIGLPEALLSPSAAVIAVRILQAVLSTATCYFAYRLALRLTNRSSAGLLAAFVLAISPAFIVEAAQILTETTYIFFMTGGIWLYVESIGSASGKRSQTLGLLVLAAVLFALATLTRAVLLAFPLGIAFHLILVRGGRKAWRQIVLFLLIYALVLSTWTIYSLARWNRFVIAGTGFSAFIYLGATSWTTPQQVDQSLQASNGSYVQGAEDVIGSNPVGWIKHRVSELVGAYLQPHGTDFYPGASLKDEALNWLHKDHSLTGFIALTRSDAFWPKLALYILHYTALVMGLAGMWLYRRRWQIALPMIGFIAYVTLVHFALLALPRYLFPNEVFWWVFAAAAIEAIFSSVIRRRTSLQVSAGS